MTQPTLVLSGSLGLLAAGIAALVAATRSSEFDESPARVRRAEVGDVPAHVVLCHCGDVTGLL